MRLDGMKTSSKKINSSADLNQPPDLASIHSRLDANSQTQPQRTISDEMMASGEYPYSKVMAFGDKKSWIMNQSKEQRSLSVGSLPQGLQSQMINYKTAMPYEYIQRGP